MKKAQVIVPTGGGKTFLEYRACEAMVAKGGKTLIVLAPSINLVHQLLNEFRKMSRVDWYERSVCSLNVSLEYYEGDDPNLILESCTQVGEIRRWLQVRDKPTVIFSTYHSAGRIRSALREEQITADLVVNDEAHNLTRETWSEYLEDYPCDRQLYFTATPRVSVDRDGEGKGMDSERYFGRVIARENPCTLIDDGSIVAPRIHMVEFDPSAGLFSGSSKLGKEVAALVSSARFHQKMVNGHDSRILVFCRSAAEAHILAASKSLKKALPGWSTGAITSRPDLMKGTRRKDILEQFTNAKRSLLFHYDVISEGIDLPGLTAVLPFRELGEVKMIQGIGRALRVIAPDRKNLRRQLIQPGRPEGWLKPYGYVIVPYIESELSHAMKKLQKIGLALRFAGFDGTVADITTVDRIPKDPTKIEDPVPKTAGQKRMEIDKFERLQKQVDNLDLQLMGVEEAITNSIIDDMAYDAERFRTSHVNSYGMPVDELFNA